MRKFILHNALNPENFNQIVKLVEKTDNDEIVTIHEEEIASVLKSKYTKEQQAKIDQCNRILENKGLDLLTEEEIEFMLDPTGVNKRLANLDKNMDDIESLQRMAGFRVEKKFIPLD
jgi:hypothetical protein